MKNKKVIIPLVITIVTLLVLVIGATYAYFMVTATNNFGTKTVTATMESIGNVALATGNNLTMNLTAEEMMNKGNDVVYYASANGTTTTATIESIGKVTVSGDGIYNCTYTLTMDDSSNSMYDTFQSMSSKSAGQIVLTINGVEYDFNTANLFSKTITGTMYGLTSEEARDITAQLKFVNETDIDQNALKGTDITITFRAISFTCESADTMLPEEYQEVEYIESTGTQYIKTGVTPINEKTNLELETMILSAPNPINAIMGGRTYALPGIVFWVAESGESAYLTYGYEDVKSIEISLNTKYVFKNVGYNFYVDDNYITSGSGSFTSPFEINIFNSANDNGVEGRVANIRVYNAKIYNNALIRNFVPCYRISDGVIGLYDLVENKFYTNSGTGTFIKGNDI